MILDKKMTSTSTSNGDFQSTVVLNKEKQRPPIYNPEDYANSLKKWINQSNFYNIYVHGQDSSVVSCSSRSNSENPVTVRSSQHSNQFNYFPLLLADSKYEMALKQFKTVSDLLSKLQIDLNVAYPSFVQEFIGDPLDGVNLLLELLRMIVSTLNGKFRNENQYSVSQTKNNFKLSALLQRKAQVDELHCIQCLLLCCVRYSEAIRRLASSNSLYTLAVCIMSNMNKSRIIALQLLTMVCESENNNGYLLVSEALSTLRLRFSEPVRFRFLVGILYSTIGSNFDLLYYGLRFINSFIQKSETPQKKLYIQAELEQAGFDHLQIKKNLSKYAKYLLQNEISYEIEKWSNNRINIEDMVKENDDLRKQVLFLESKIQKLQEEKVINEFRSRKLFSKKQNDDEGISSSERSSASGRSDKTNLKADSTTIDEVIEEMNNIVNEVEKKNSSNEIEIIPNKLQPLPPPKKVKSLIYLSTLNENELAQNMNMDFYENKSCRTLSNESCSNSLLSISEILIENYKRNCIENFDKSDSMLDGLSKTINFNGKHPLKKSTSFHCSETCKFRSIATGSVSQFFSNFFRAKIQAGQRNLLKSYNICENSLDSMKQVNKEEPSYEIVNGNHNLTNIKIKIGSPRINVFPDWKYEETRFYKENYNFLPNTLFKRKNCLENVHKDFDKLSMNLTAVKSSVSYGDNFYLNKSTSSLASNQTMIQIFKNSLPKNVSVIEDELNSKRLRTTKLSDLPSGLY